MLLIAGSIALSSACGGGSSGGGDSTSETPQSQPEPEPEQEPEPEPETPATSRITRVDHDLDNDGTVDGVESVSYDSNGNLASIHYVYTGDSSADRTDGVSRLLFEDSERRLSYAYDSSGQLVQEVDERPGTSGGVARIVLDLQWDSDGLVSGNVWEYFNGDGALLSRNTASVSYQGSLVSGWTDSQESVAPLAGASTGEGRVSYDSNQQPTGMSYENSSSTFSKALTWSQGRTERVITTTPSATEQMDYRFSADGQRLVERTITRDGNTERYDFLYDNDTRLTEVRIDRDNDGEVDIVQRATWEDGACRDALLWAGLAVEVPMLTSAASPYVNGTGYTLIDYCQSNGHLRD
ncbi:MAG: hypothetical protein ACK5HY_16810 [Parahaliea sp.]